MPWPFAQLLSFICYKAALTGIQVVEEGPRHTGQQCSRRRHTERGNRPRQGVSKCKACGYEVHADLNAARNPAAGGTCPSGVPGRDSPRHWFRAGKIEGKFGGHLRRTFHSWCKILNKRQDNLARLAMLFTQCTAYGENQEAELAFSASLPSNPKAYGDLG